MAGCKVNTSTDTIDELKGILENSDFKKPSLIVFDLDFTLWPYFVNNQYTLPFKLTTLKNNKKAIIDAKNRKVVYFPEVPRIFDTLTEKFVSNGGKLAIASRSRSRQAATELLDILGWTKYFSSIQIYQGNKSRHIKTICTELNLKLNEVMFFDDDPDNFAEVMNAGVKCVSINKNTGLTISTIIDGFNTYNKKN